MIQKKETKIAFGTSKECAEKLGIKVESFYYAISRQNRGVGKENTPSLVKSSNPATEEERLRNMIT